MAPTFTTGGTHPALLPPSGASGAFGDGCVYPPLRSRGGGTSSGFTSSGSFWQATMVKPSVGEVLKKSSGKSSRRKPSPFMFMQSAEHSRVAASSRITSTVVRMQLCPMKATRNADPSATLCAPRAANDPAPAAGLGDGECLATPII